MKTKFQNLPLLAVLFGFTLTGSGQQTNHATLIVAPPPGREPIRVLYNEVYRPNYSPPLNWTGNYTNGDPGSISIETQNAELARLNVVRVMSGGYNLLTLNSISNDVCQQAALMMSANRTNSHYPSPTWKYYTQAGADAARLANIALGTYGPDAITAYMNDGLGNNAGVPHRRWILYPQTRVMGLGDVPALGTYLGANVLLRSDGNLNGPRPPTKYGFVAWPPPGYVPYQMMPVRWSISYPNASFSTNSISVVRNGTNVPVRAEAIEYGAGENTLVWVIDGINANAPEAQFYQMPKPSVDTPITVTVSNVIINNIAQTFTYTVIIFDPEIPGNDTVLPDFAVGSSTNVMVGIDNRLSFIPVPLATGYELRVGKKSSYTYVESGEQSKLTNILMDVSPGYASVATIDSAHAGEIDGTKSFHLACPDSKPNQTITLKRIVIPTAASQLTFLSRFGKSTPDQSAVILVSQDDGNTWSEINRQTGTGGDWDYEFNFIPRSYSLGAYAGKTIAIRFDYQSRRGGASFINTSVNYGWWIDKIAVTAASEMTEAATAVTAGGTNDTSAVLRPSATGSWAAQIRAQVFNVSGSFHAEWGRPIELNAIPGPPRMNPLTFPGNGKIRLSFLAETGRKYNLEYKTNLTQISWATLTSSLSGSNVTLTFDDPIVPGKSRFYRINQTQ